MAAEDEFSSLEPDQNVWAEAYAQVTADPALRHRLQDGESPINILKSVRGNVQENLEATTEQSPNRVDYETDVLERYAAAISETPDILPRLDTTPRHELGEDYYQRQQFYRDRTVEPVAERLASAQREFSFTPAEREAARAIVAPASVGSAPRAQSQLTEGKTL